MHSFLLLLLLVLGGIAYSESNHELKSGKYCFSACDYTLRYVSFNDTSPKLPKITKSCASKLDVVSQYLCAAVYCTESGRQDWLVEKNERCEEHANITLPPYDAVVATYTDDAIENIRRLRAEEATWNSRMSFWAEVVIPEETFFDRAFRTWEASFTEMDVHWEYAIAMYYFWAIVVSIGICTRLLSLIQGLQRQDWKALPQSECDEPERDASAKYRGFFSLPYYFLKTYIIHPATFGYRCSQNVQWCTIPPRLQSLTILAFVALNVLLCSINYHVFADNIFWPKKSDQYWRYISDRTGIISFANFPLVWLFGTRNSTLMWLTGWGFGTYNSFHRWVARVATVQAVVHSIGYTNMIFEGGGWPSFWKYWHKRYFWNGELATIFMCGILAFSVYGLRRSHYEVFLYIHILFSIIALLTMWYHVEIFNREYDIFFWPCVVIWVFDRLLRGLRILAFNPRFWSVNGRATYNFESNLIRLEVRRSQSFLKPKSGTYYYLHVLNDLYFWQNHPFTLAYATGGKDIMRPLTPVRATARNSFRPPLSRGSSSQSDESEFESLLPSSSHTKTGSSSLVFLIRPYDGFTSRLMKRALSNPANLHVLVEGPYGDTQPLQHFTNVLFLVGGTGIAVPLSHLEDLLSECSHTHSVHIVWAVREHAFLADVVRQDFRGLLGHEKLTVTVHLTQEEWKDDAPDGALKHAGVHLRSGRPDVERDIEEAAEQTGQGGLAVVACGPAQMADDARRASVRALKRGCRGVEYFEESFKW